MKRSIVHFLGFFGEGSTECTLCAKVGGRVAWLCRGEVLVADLCRAHADRVPRKPTQVHDIFGELRVRGRVYELRGAMRRRRAA